MKINNQKDQKVVNFLNLKISKSDLTISILACAMIALMLWAALHVFNSSILRAKEIHEHAELIEKHHESKIGHFVISSYENCMKKNNQLPDAKVKKTECIQLAIDSTKTLGSAASTDEGGWHLREYIRENEEYEERRRSKDLKS